jgi:hypothetical protein
MSLGTLIKGACPLGFPHEALIERDAPVLQPSLTCLSESPVKKPSLQVAIWNTYIQRDDLLPEPSFSSLSECPMKEPSLHIHITELPQREGLCSTVFFYLSLKVPFKGPHISRLPQQSCCGERCPFSKPSFMYLSKSILKELFR